MVLYFLPPQRTFWRTPFTNMKTPLLMSLSLIGGLVASSCGPGPGEAAQNVPLADNSSSTALYQDVNRYRQNFNKKPLARHSGLDSIALRHSEFMRRNRGKFQFSKTGNVTHYGFESRYASASHNYRFVTLHENVAAGPRGTSITRVWAASRSHEPAMRGNWTHTGVGVVVDSDGMIFATQLFGSIGSHRELQLRYGPY